TRAVQLLFEERAQGALFALSGSLAGRTWEQLAQIAPWLGGGLLLSLLAAPRVNVLTLGEDVARSLGARTERDRVIVTGLGVLLAAGSVSVSGPIGFVGLIVPHAARALIGPDHRLSLPLAALLGAGFLTLADTAARLIDRPAETPVGILVAAVGAPVFVLIARRVGRRE
ncbi:FecCD family ABC transporter permease, partial [Deinococcus aquaticus]|uniref:FecCD family ABC transporter permease n=1 Tax=Deinococcus aquaticus TaxID=328692 RepID=UPI003F4512BC